MTDKPANTPGWAVVGAELRTRVLSSAIRLLEDGGQDAVTIRAVAAGAGVQAPALYRLFEDKNALLEAVAAYGFATYMREENERLLGADPVEDLRIGWDLHIAFGLTNPAVYVMMYGEPQAGRVPQVAAAAFDRLRGHLRTIAATGRLRIPEERAAAYVHACGMGVVFSLLTQSVEERDMGLSKMTCEAVIGAIIDDSPAIASPTAATAAIALRALLPKDGLLSAGERRLLIEWLDRLGADPRGSQHEL